MTDEELNEKTLAYLVERPGGRALLWDEHDVADYLDEHELLDDDCNHVDGVTVTELVSRGALQAEYERGREAMASDLTRRAYDEVREIERNMVAYSKDPIDQTKTYALRHMLTWIRHTVERLTETGPRER